MDDSHAIKMEQMLSSMGETPPAMAGKGTSTTDVDAHSTLVDPAPSSTEDLRISEEVNNLVQKIKVGSSVLGQSGETGRKQLLADARALSLTLETPIETLLRITWSQVLSIQTSL